MYAAWITTVSVYSLSPGGIWGTYSTNSAVIGQLILHASVYAKWQLPDEVIAKEALPLGPTGKIDKKTIRANLADEGYQLPDLR